MSTFSIVVAVAVVGFIAGVLVGRKNKNTVNAVVADVNKVALAANAVSTIIKSPITGSVSVPVVVVSPVTGSK